MARIKVSEQCSAAAQPSITSCKGSLFSLSAKTHLTVRLLFLELQLRMAELSLLPGNIHSKIIMSSDWAALCLLCDKSNPT